MDRTGSDLWCRIESSLFTVQVKSASFPRAYAKSPVRYHFDCGNHSQVDWYCFVALDRQLVLLSPASEVITKSIRLLPEEFNAANQRRTIEQFLKKC